MKDAKSIISHLVKHPSMKKYEQMLCFERLLGLLPKSFTSMIKFIYIKNETLFFVLNHPSAKMEFNYKQSLIKSLLSQIIIHCPQCECLHVKDIKCFITNQKEDSASSTNSSDITYKERACGEFENHCDDQKLKTLFENIKEIIKSNQC